MELGGFTYFALADGVPIELGWIIHNAREMSNYQI
jgi:hypothetical protein